MHLMYLPGPDGHRTYTLKKSLDGRATISAHPARFSPDDKFSRERLIAKSRFRDRMADGWLDATLLRGEKTDAAAKEVAKGDVDMDEPKSE